MTPDAGPVQLDGIVRMLEGVSKHTTHHATGKSSWDCIEGGRRLMAGCDTIPRSHPPPTPFRPHFLSFQVTHSTFALGLARVLDMIFWMYSYKELTNHAGSKSVGMFVLLTQFVHIIIMGDFFYYYAIRFGSLACMGVCRGSLVVLRFCYYFCRVVFQGVCTGLLPHWSSCVYSSLVAPHLRSPACWKMPR